MGSLLCVLVSAALGLLFCLDSGQYWVNVFNDFGANLPLLIIGMCEICACIWFFGIESWTDELKFMIGPKKGWMDRALRYYFYVCWNFLSPLLLFVVLGGYIYT